MEVGISTASFYPDALTEDAIPFIDELGVKKAEIFLETYSEYNEDFCLMVKDKLDQCGIRAYSVHALSTQFEAQLFSLTERQRRDAREILMRILKGARIMGAQAYVFHGPGVRINTRPVLDYKRIGMITSELCDIAGEYGVKFTWENVYWCWFSFPEFADRIIEHVKSDNLYFTLDIKQAIKSEKDPFDFLRHMGSRLTNVHVCDFDADGNLYLPGRGSFDFDRLYRELDSLAYQGPVILEVYRNNYGHYKEMVESLNFLRKKFEDRV